jgi:hypothetical protein
MSTTFNTSSGTFSLSDDGQSVTNAAGQTMPIGMLPAGSEVAIAAQNARGPQGGFATPLIPTGPSLLSQAGNAIGQGAQWLGKATGGGAMGELDKVPIAGIEAPNILRPAPTQQPPYSSAVGMQQPPGAIMKPEQPPLPQGEIPPQVAPQLQPAPRVATGGGMGTGRTSGVGQAMENVYGAERARSEAEQQAEVDRSIYEAQKGEVYAERARQLEAEAAKRAELEAERQKVFAAENKKLTTLETDVKNATIKDPWANRSIGKRIGQAIAMALGAYSASINGGPNQALAIINKNMDDDLKVQQLNLEQKNTNLTNARGLLARTRQEYADRATALDAARLAGTMQAQLELNAIDSSGLSQDAANKKEILNGLLNEQIAGQKLNVLAAQQAAREKAMAGRQGKALEDYKLNAPVLDARLLDQKDRERIAIIDGKAYMAPRAQDRKDLQDAANEVIGLADDVRKMDAYVTGTNPATRAYNASVRNEQYGAIKATVVQSQMRLKNMWTLGVLSKDDYVKLDAAIPDPTDVASGSSHGKLQTMLASTRTSLKNKLNGLQRVENVPGLRPTVQYDVGAPVK